MQSDEHLLTVLRYVQRNAVRAKLVRQAAQWPHAAEWVRRRGTPRMRALLSEWPIERSDGWSAWVNEAQTPAEIKTLRAHVRRSHPCGDDRWVRQTAAMSGLQWTPRPRAGQKRESSGE